MCRYNDTLEELQHEMLASMVLRPLSLSSIHFYPLQLWKIRGHGVTTPVEKMKMMMMAMMKTMRSRKNQSKDRCFSFSLFGV
jgi:hypothetical protein